MNKLIISAIATFSFVVSFAQYTHTDYAPNGNKLAQGQYNANPKIQAGDSKETIAQKLSGVHKMGSWKYWYDNGQVSAEETYDNNGKPTGVWKTYYNTGAAATEVNYITGVAKYYYPNGKVSEEGTMDSQQRRIGTWKGFHENGAVNYTGSYGNTGAKVGTWTYYSPYGVVTGTEKF
ncbi:MAG: hypothetical protein LW750_00410 [Bacteroidetes bacterium]|jgi:antitoxin component YwqK of YwqJK toxin-antitoxin module|nr:hypothetical protein [Bacteroidota bacterium]